MVVSHHWPRRHFIQPRVGVAVEPQGHSEDGEPLYDFYLSTTQETRRLTEAEVREELRRLASTRKTTTSNRHSTGYRRKPRSANRSNRSKKTSATLIRGSDKFASLESLFLGHAGGTIAHRHYAKAPQNLLDQAIDWLATEYGVEYLRGGGAACIKPTDLQCGD